MIFFRYSITLFVAGLIIMGCYHKKPRSGYAIKQVKVRSVTLTDSFWLPKVKLIQDSTISYAFAKCNEEGRMENFLIAGKIMEGKTKGKMPFDDTDLYKIIEGASLSLVSTPNKKLELYLDSIITIIKKGQEPDGYLTTWFTIDRKNPPASWVKPSETRWENEISSHELYNSGHLFEAAAAHYWVTGKRNLLRIAIKNADLLVESFKPGKLQMPPGHQIVETGLIKLFEITKKEKYLSLSKYFLDLRGDSISHKLYGKYNQDHLPVIKQSSAVGHAVRAEYMYAAMTDIGALYHDQQYIKAVNTIWDNIVYSKTYITGGVGARHEGESFGEDFELPNLSAYSETCAAIGSVSWNQRMFQLTGQSKYYDIIERTLYNGLISGLSVDGKKFFYPNPLESDGKYRFNMGSCTRQGWFDCSCCPTNLIRFIPSLPGLIYGQKNDSIFVNLYMSNKANFSIRNRKIELEQITSYPWSGKVKLLINSPRKFNYTLMFRIPGWTKNEPVPGDLYTYIGSIGKSTKITINNELVNFKEVDGYAYINRTWSKGDVIEINFPTEVHKVKASSYVHDDLTKVAYEYGPIVYCLEEIDNADIAKVKLTEDLHLQPHREHLLRNKVNVLTGINKDQLLKFIPYYLWSNRGVGQMKVWIEEE